MACAFFEGKHDGFPIHPETGRNALIVGKGESDGDVFSSCFPGVESLKLMAERVHVNTHFIQNRFFECDGWSWFRGDMEPPDAEHVCKEVSNLICACRVY